MKDWSLFSARARGVALSGSASSSCTRRQNGEKIALPCISHTNSVQIQLLSVRPDIECVVPDRVLATSCTFSAALDTCADDTLVCTRQTPEIRDAMLSTSRQYCCSMPSSPTSATHGTVPVPRLGQLHRPHFENLEEKSS